MAESRTSRRGFASMSPERQREIARKGGEAVSKNREHMAQIGRKGGEASHGSGRGGTVHPIRQSEEHSRMNTEQNPDNNRDGGDDDAGIYRAS